MKTPPNDADALIAGHCKTLSLVRFVPLGYSHARGRCAVILGMPV